MRERRALVGRRRETMASGKSRPREREANPTKSRCALLLIDVINDLEFDGGEALLRHALPMARRLARLVARAREAAVPVIYANDNFGHWRSDFRAQVRHCLEEGVRGRPIAELLRPEPSDFFVLKPKHSAFFATPLDVLLRSLETEALVLAGLAGDNCVLFTAHDAYMLEYELYVPRDAIASEEVANNRAALEHVRRILKADVRESSRLDLRALGPRARGRGGAASRRTSGSCLV